MDRLKSVVVEERLACVGKNDIAPGRLVWIKKVYHQVEMENYTKSCETVLFILSAVTIVVIVPLY
tara:strand:- start:539 stop:733 length:195 start_codon:yes stop_codon:yes gene_type:complete